jgi:hypothetical protein
MTDENRTVKPMKVEVELGFLLPRLRRLALDGDAECLDQLVGLVAHVAAWHGALAHENGLDCNEASRNVKDAVLEAMKGEGELASIEVS